MDSTPQVRSTMSSTPPIRISTPPIPTPPHRQLTRTPSTATLVISDFSKFTEGHKGTAICASGPNGKQSRFYLALFPKNSLTWVSNDVLVCLYFYDDDIEVKYRVAIVNGKREKRYCQEYHWRRCRKLGHHVAKFISRDEILDPENFCLVNDKLTIVCELDILTPDDIDQSKFSTLTADLSQLLQSSQFADTKLLVRGKEFPVHRAVLSARSPVFEKMFDHDCKEKINGVVDIDDLSQDVCEQFLKFIYADKVDDLEAMAPELLSAADKYQLDSLKNLCEHYLSSTLSIDTASRLLLLADTHQAKQLKCQCIDYITDHIAKVKLTDSWKTVTKARPELGIELLMNLSTKHEQLKGTV